MAVFKTITKDTNIDSLKMYKLDWDVVIYNRPYYVVRINGYVHSISNRYGENNLWAYPRDEEPSYENLVQFECAELVRWGIRYEPRNYISFKYEEPEAMSGGRIIITRNDADFCEIHGGLSYGIDKARIMIEEFKEHPLPLEHIDYDKKMIGRKVWWRSEPAIITSYVDGQAAIILEPDGIEHFTVPAEFAKDDPDYYCEGSVKTSILDKHIWWFRD